MRFLHTGDWHIGKTLRGRNRSGEQEAVLREILDISLREKLDLVLVSGDIFDSHSPSPEAERLVYWFFAELIGQELPAVLIAGNHDHPRRLSALRQLVQPLGLYVVSELDSLPTRNWLTVPVGGTGVQIVTIPFILERRLVSAEDLIGPDGALFRTYEERMGAIIQQACSTLDLSAVNLAMAHLYVRGAKPSGSERMAHVAHPYEVGADVFPDVVQYAALGHLHRPQTIQGRTTLRYCGSPLQLDFGEQGQQKEVVVAEVVAGQPATTRSLPLTSGRQLLDVTGTLAELEERAAEWSSAYLRVIVQSDAPQPGIAEEVKRFLPDALDIRIDYPRHSSDAPQGGLNKLTPEGMYEEFFLAQHGSPPPGDLLKLFSDLYQEVADEAS